MERVSSLGQTADNTLASTRMTRSTDTESSNGKKAFLISRSDGRVYKGGWVDGLQDGTGVFVTNGNKERKGEWKKGSRTKWLD